MVYNGSTAAVMMGTPQDLPDFLIGFARSEGIVMSPADVTDIEVLRHPNGIEVRGRIPDDRASALDARRRGMTGPVGCGLCGIDSLEAALREPPRVHKMHAHLVGLAANALTALDTRQVLRRQSRGMHAAGYFDVTGLRMMREDVGRHNALDKLIGALGSRDLSGGAVLLTSRISIDLVQKAAQVGLPAVFSVSSPTRGAADLAERIGMTLVTHRDGGEFILDPTEDVPQ
ncbi:formate dehydrogenase accessory sulfurtransferase FdhD [Celeribacter arenosi]|uniref:Formate dehydrogenase accessory sulfurtransferase FdhD n=1 Tax=Celeribacter arenosi TaxID=792649 RepID=A0ABP7K4F1_9RHOB